VNILIFLSLKKSFSETFGILIPKANKTPFIYLESEQKELLELKKQLLIMKMLIIIIMIKM
jgi:hypothetical protein